MEPTVCLKRFPAEVLTSRSSTELFFYQSLFVVLEHKINKKDGMQSPDDGFALFQQTTGGRKMPRHAEMRPTKSGKKTGRKTWIRAAFMFSLDAPTSYVSLRAF